MNANTNLPSTTCWLTVKQLAQAQPAFSELALRNLVFYSASRTTSKGLIKGNGLDQHIRRVGKKILINYGGFLSWIEGS